MFAPSTLTRRSGPSGVIRACLLRSGSERVGSRTDGIDSETCLDFEELHTRGRSGWLAAFGHGSGVLGGDVDNCGGVGRDRDRPEECPIVDLPVADDQSVERSVRGADEGQVPNRPGAENNVLEAGTLRVITVLSATSIPSPQLL